MSDTYDIQYTHLLSRMLLHSQFDVCVSLICRCIEGWYANCNTVFVSEDLEPKWQTHARVVWVRFTA